MHKQRRITKVILYHGSNIEIEKIDLNKCKPHKDFGCGFYTTPLKDQALSMAIKTMKIFREGKPCITEFTCDDDLFCMETKTESSSFNIKRFNEPNIEWARFVIGPVANDDITALVDVYLTGIISDEALAKELTYRDLSIQISFHTKKSINYLQKTGTHYD